MPRVIKRYPNRKLYDADARAYVSLEEIAALVRDGETVQVLDHATGDDITAQTLTQVILDEGRRGTSLLPPTCCTASCAAASRPSSRSSTRGCRASAPCGSVSTASSAARSIA